MAWYENHAADIGSAAVLLLAVLGVAVSLLRGLTAHAVAKWVFVISFVVIAGIAWYSNKIGREVTEARLTGGSNYCFLAIRQDGDNFMWQRRNSGRFQIPRMQMTMEKKDKAGEYKKIHWIYKDFTCIPGSIDAPGFSVVLGEYRVFFTAANGEWYEYLTLRV